MQQQDFSSENEFLVVSVLCEGTDVGSNLSC